MATVDSSTCAATTGFTLTQPGGSTVVSDGTNIIITEVAGSPGLRRTSAVTGVSGMVFEFKIQQPGVGFNDVMIGIVDADALDYLQMVGCYQTGTGNLNAWEKGGNTADNVNSTATLATEYTITCFIESDGRVTVRKNSTVLGHTVVATSGNYVGKSLRGMIQYIGTAGVFQFNNYLVTNSLASTGTRRRRTMDSSSGMTLFQTKGTVTFGSVDMGRSACKIDRTDNNVIDWDQLGTVVNPPTPDSTSGTGSETFYWDFRPTNTSLDFMMGFRHTTGLEILTSAAIYAASSNMNIFDSGTTIGGTYPPGITEDNVDGEYINLKAVVNADGTITFSAKRPTDVGYTSIGSSTASSGTFAAGNIYFSANLFRDAVSDNNDSVYVDNWIYSADGVITTAITDLALNHITSTENDLTWTASLGAAAYAVYREGVFLIKVLTNSYNDTGLVADADHDYRVVPLNGDDEDIADPSNLVFYPPLAGGDEEEEIEVFNIIKRKK